MPACNVVDVFSELVIGVIFNLMNLDEFVSFISYHIIYLLDQFKELQKISFGRGFILGVDLFHLPALSREPLLVCGGDDAKVHLFARQEGKVYINFMYK